MEPFELNYYHHRRPPLVKAAPTPHDFDFEDDNLFARVLGTPNKIDIPERYIPEQWSRDPEEEAKRSKKAAAICRILSKSSAGALAHQLRLPLVLPPPTTPALSATPALATLALTQRQPQALQGHKSDKSTFSNGGSTSGFSSGSNSRVGSLNGSLPTSPVRRAVSIKKIPLRVGRRCGSETPSSNSRCDWSLAGVSVAPNQSCETSNSGSRGRESREREVVEGRGRCTSDYYSYSGSAVDLDSRINSHNSYSSSYLSPKTRQGQEPDYYSTNWRQTADRGRRGVPATAIPLDRELKSKSSSYLTLSSGGAGSGTGSAPLTPFHSYHSSVSSTSSSDREELLHLHHSLAREVTVKSRLVAVRALAASPGLGLPNRYSPLRPPTPPSPSELPTIQQREGFFT